jgi:hypothetical protein
MQEMPHKMNFEQAFVLGVQDGASLLRKELTVNHAEQVLLQKRVQLMREFINDLPSTDPQYSMIAGAIEMDRIELDELKVRSSSILQKMEGI